VAALGQGSRECLDPEAARCDLGRVVLGQQQDAHGDPFIRGFIQVRRISASARWCTHGSLEAASSAMFKALRAPSMLDRFKPPRIPRRRWSRRLLRHYAPPIPSGWHTGPPDFVGVGAQRSGSSWWFRFAVESHPKVVRMEDQLKELHYFDRFWNGEVPADLVERYHRFFPRPQGSITGEWTPRYMFDYWSMRLLREAAPDAQILVILRDPIERFRSGFAMRRRWGMTRGRMLDALATAVARSAYADQLRRVFDFYPAEQVLVLQYERCVIDPAGEMARTLRFLDLEPPAEPPRDLRETSRAPAGKPELPAGMRRELQARLGPDVERLIALCPELDVSLWRNFADLSATPRER
jgi:hypothetical protein